MDHLATYLQYQGFLNTGPWAFIWQFSPVRHNNVCAKYWPMGFYSEENCQTEAHGPLLDWASGRKALGTMFIKLVTTTRGVMRSAASSCAAMHMVAGSRPVFVIA